jgi:starch phosphorylase
MWRWSGRRDSNPLPQPWEGRALPGELLPRPSVDQCNAIAPAREDLRSRRCPLPFAVVGNPNARPFGQRLFAELEEVALDLTWTWDHRIAALFPALAPDQWDESGHNPMLLLARLGAEGVAAAMGRPGVEDALEAARTALRQHRERPSIRMATGAPLLVAYFSMEFGLAEILPLYSGGLGVLAGDHLKAASDLGLPLVGVGLLYRQGFGRQRIDPDGNQSEIYPEIAFEALPIERVRGAHGPLEVTCPVGEREVRVALWSARVGRVRLVLLDTDLEANPPDLRAITSRLYVPEPHRRLPQEIVLGIAGLRALRAMGIAPTVFHMNEGHGFLLPIERMRELRQERQISLEEARLVTRAGFVFTTHTPIAAGSDRFEPALVRGLLGPYLAEAGLDVERFLDLGRRTPGDATEPLTTTYVGLRMSDHSLGVSRLHAAVSRRLWKDAWPGLPENQVPISHVTNGVHMPTWVAPEIGRLLSRHVGEAWCDLDEGDPRWAGIDTIPDAELWEAHRRLKRRLIEAARAQGTALDPEALTIGFGRRFAAYKRANLLLRDRDRLQHLLADGQRPVQIVFSGKAHPADQEGKAVLRDIVALARTEPRVAFLEDYDLEVARLLVQGSDVWLNNPRRFLEASGTSGMKAAANGALNVSILDGWWDEGYRPGAGWAIPSGATIDRPEPDDDAEVESLFRLLEREVVPTFYARNGAGLPAAWLAMMRASMRSTLARFSARRMVVEYATRCYVPAAERVEQLRLLPDWGG